MGSDEMRGGYWGRAMPPSDRLDRATERFEKGEDKRALRDLWVVGQTAAHLVGLKRVLEMATVIHDRNTGRIRNDAHNLILAVKARIHSLEPAGSSTEVSSASAAGSVRSAPKQSIPTAPAAAGAKQGAVAGWVLFCVWCFGLAAVLSVIGGIVTGIAASDNLGPELRAQLRAEGVSANDVGIDSRDEGILVAWIIGGFVAAALWIGLAVLLVLLRDAVAGIATLVRQGGSSSAEPADRSR